MDTMRDFPGFRALMDQINAVVTGTDFKASDAKVQAHWDALRDCSLADVTVNAKRFMATATKDSRFPPPSALRSVPAQLSAAPDPSREKHEREAVRRWEELRKTDPIAWEVLLRAARAARSLVELGEDDPGYDAAVREQYRWDRLRYAPRAEQEAAVNRYHGRT
jgi:hypothetical protein